jgi:2-polyprenyl-3-methyl-5-hydroxy-6-metoxy-1,4-benzoquinol methylase
MDMNGHSMIHDGPASPSQDDEPPVSGYYSQERSEVARLLPGTFVRTLEIGCGAGGFTRHFLHSASENWAVEPNVEAARLATARKIHVQIGTYDEVESALPDSYFDLVICNDVIEHMRDHDQFLRSVQKKMTPGGVIVGSIPNMRYFTALVKLLALKDWPYSDEGILDRTHLRFFTRKSLERSLTSAGFELERLEGVHNFLKYGSPGVATSMNLPLKCGAALLVALSCGYWSDILYRQFVFRVKLPLKSDASEKSA